MQTNLDQTLSFSLWSQLRRIPPRERNWPVYLAGVAAAAAVTIIGLWTVRFVSATSLAILYTLAVVWCALRWGRIAAIVSAFSSAVLLNWFFVPPFRSLLWSDVWDSVTLAGFLAIGLIVSTLAVSAREEARQARRRAAYIEALYSLARSLVESEGVTSTLEEIERHFRETFARPLVIAVPSRRNGPHKLETLVCSKAFFFDAEEQSAAEWCLQNAEPAGSGTSHFPMAKARYLPLKTTTGIMGVLGLWSPDPGFSSSERLELLNAFADQAALAIARALLAEEARRAALLQDRQTADGAAQLHLSQPANTSRLGQRRLEYSD